MPSFRESLSEGRGQGRICRAHGKTDDPALPSPNDRRSRKLQGRPALPADALDESTQGSRPLLQISSLTGRRRFGRHGPPCRFRPL
eukprot:287292-Heterocapsa_arctica.AAC.1